MKDQYMAPELKLVGTADEVVFGSLLGGSDLSDQFLPHGAPFELDILEPTHSSHT